MTDLNQLLVNLKDFATQYFLLTTIDHERFKLYMNNFYYSNGEIIIDSKNNHSTPTTYNKGTLITDSTRKIFFNEGTLTTRSDESIEATNGTLNIS